MRLDHTLIPALDKEKSAKFIAAIMNADYIGVVGEQALVRVNDVMYRFDERRDGRIHLAFHLSTEEFDQTIGRLRVLGTNFGPRANQLDGQIGELDGGPRIFFEDPGGQSWELLTVPSVNVPGS